MRMFRCSNTPICPSCDRELDADMDSHSSGLYRLGSETLYGDTSGYAAASTSTIRLFMKQ